MTKDDIIKLAREAAAKRGHTFREVPQVETVEFLEAFFLMASEAEREEILQMSRDKWFKTQADFEAAIAARWKHD